MTLKAGNKYSIKEMISLNNWDTYLIAILSIITKYATSPKYWSFALILVLIATIVFLIANYRQLRLEKTNLIEKIGESEETINKMQVDLDARIANASGQKQDKERIKKERDSALEENARLTSSWNILNMRFNYLIGFMESQLSDKDKAKTASFLNAAKLEEENNDKQSKQISHSKNR